MAQRDSPLQAFSLAMKGHSFVMTGSCGTGKTYNLKKIISKLSQSKSVAVTATTGMASLQLEMNASTLHHWVGISDGRYNHQELEELFDNDDRFASAKKRILSSDCLVIDEISMLSKKTFEMVEFVCRQEEQPVFWWLADFKQLPPVPNKYVNDDGEYCFRSLLFDVTFPHHIKLLKVIRQTEPDLAKAVQELGDGSPSTETIQLLRSLNARLDATDEQICRLFGSNFDVRFVNEQMLEQLPGNVQVFRAIDKGNHRILHCVAVPKTLLLKEGATVILVKNLGGRLFNGQKGYVHKLQVDSPPVINFNGELHQLKPEVFEIFDASENSILASRTQIPVILGFAMTVHRAQGQTLEYIEVDCSSFFAPGEMGVAVGRAFCKKGLRIINFNMEVSVMKHPDSVYNFYKTPFQALKDDMSCCNKTMIEVNESLPSESYSEFFFRRTFIENESDTEVHAEDLPRSLCEFDINELIELNKSADFVALMDKDFIASEQFKCHLEYLNFKTDECISIDSNTNKKWVNAFKSLNQFLVGKEHVNAIKELFHKKNKTKHQNKLSSKLSLWLMEKKIKLKTDCLQYIQLQVLVKLFLMLVAAKFVI